MNESPCFWKVLVGLARKLPRLSDPLMSGFGTLAECQVLCLDFNYKFTHSTRWFSSCGRHRSSENFIPFFGTTSPTRPQVVRCQICKRVADTLRTLSIKKQTYSTQSTQLVVFVAAPLPNDSALTLIPSMKLPTQPTSDENSLRNSLSYAT